MMKLLITCGSFATYMGNYARNKTRVKFAGRNSSASKNSYVKVSSQRCAITKIDFFCKHLESQKLIGN